MYIVIENRDVVANGYKAGFEREGLACSAFTMAEFSGWLQSLSEPDVAAIQGIILGECEERLSVPALVRTRGRPPIVALKEERGLEETLALFNVGVDDVVKKPASVRELVARCHAIWRRACDAREEARFGRLVVYFDARDPTVDDDPVELPRRERQILEYLVKNRRRRITKSQLFNAIYGLFNESVDETVIEGHISKLRKKLRQRLGYDVIDAKRFAGYTFVGEAGAHDDAGADAAKLVTPRTPALSLVSSNPNPRRPEPRVR